MPSPRSGDAGPPRLRIRPRVAVRSRRSRRRAWSSLNPRWKSRAILRSLYERSAVGIRISNAGLRGPSWAASEVRTVKEGRGEGSARRQKVLARARGARDPRWGMKRHELLELMQTLDDAWNKQDWPVFRQRHAADTAVYWPGQPEPTRGRPNHESEAKEFFKTFPDNPLINRPYKILFADGNHTCSVADFYGTMKGPMKTADGKTIPPTNKSFHVEFCTVATWNEKGEITEERLFYDLVGLMRQIGLT